MTQVSVLAVCLANYGQPARAKSGTVWRLVAPAPDARNNPGRPPRVQIAESALPDTPGTLSIPPISVNLHTIAIQ